MFSVLIHRIVLYHNVFRIDTLYCFLFFFTPRHQQVSHKTTTMTEFTKYQQQILHKSNNNNINTTTTSTTTSTTTNVEAPEEEHEAVEEGPEVVVSVDVGVGLQGDVAEDLQSVETFWNFLETFHQILS